jgi:2-dehydropantoate 2-reductase
MDDIQNVAILGMGAMGAYFASQFLQVEEISTCAIASGERAERLTRLGFIINGKHFMIPVKSPDTDGDPADLIIVAVKNYHLSEAAPLMENLVGEKTLILSVMNGIDSEEYLGSIYGMEKLLYAVSVGIDAVREGNQVTYTKPGKHYFGEARNPQISPRVKRVQAAFDRARITYETPLDMVRMMWWKFMVNVGMNQTSAVLNAPYGVFLSSREACDLMDALMLEVVQLAQVEGVDLSEQDIEEWYRVMSTLAPLGKTSMLQDIEAGRKTEVDTFAGKVVELGTVHRISTPINQTFLRIIRFLES